MRGHIRRRGKSYSAVVYLGKHEKTGKPQYRWTTHRTRAAAETHLTEQLKILQGGGWLPDSTLTLKDFLALWMEQYVAGAVAPTTQRMYRYVIEAHLVPVLGAIRIAKLSPHTIQAYFADRLKAGLSPTTVNSHAKLLKQALGHAVRWRYLAVNPCASVDPPKRRHREWTLFSLDQVLAFLEAAKASRYYRLFLAAILTGMRQGELLGLRWQDVDLKAGVATVRQTFYRLGREVIFKAPKTKTSRRRIDLPPHLVQELTQLRAEQAELKAMWGPEYADLDLVFAQSDGKPLHAHDVTMHDLRGILDEAQLPRIRFHDLRHLHASLLFGLKTHPKTVQSRLGHSSIGITMDLYTHLIPGMEQEKAASDEVEATLFPTRALADISKPAPKVRRPSR